MPLTSGAPQDRARLRIGIMAERSLISFFLATSRASQAGRGCERSEPGGRRAYNYAQPQPWTAPIRAPPGFQRPRKGAAGPVRAGPGREGADGGPGFAGGVRGGGRGAARPKVTDEKKRHKIAGLRHSDFVSFVSIFPQIIVYRVLLQTPW